MSIRTIAQQLKELKVDIMAYAENNNGELCESLEQEKEQLEQDFSDAIDDAKRRIITLEERILSQKQLIDKARENIQDYEDGIALIKRSVALSLEGEKYKSKYCSVYYSNTTRVEIGCETETLPEEYVRKTEKIEPDKKGLKKALENGKIIKGVELVPNTTTIIR